MLTAPLCARSKHFQMRNGQWKVRSVSTHLKNLPLFSSLTLNRRRPLKSPRRPEKNREKNRTLPSDRRRTHEMKRNGWNENYQSETNARKEIDKKEIHHFYVGTTATALMLQCDSPPTLGSSLIRSPFAVRRLGKVLQHFADAWMCARVMYTIKP